jgi:hypothetical protein
MPLLSAKVKFTEQRFLLPTNDFLIIVRMALPKVGRDAGKLVGMLMVHPLWKTLAIS